MKTLALVALASLLIAIGCGESQEKATLERACKSGDASGCLALGRYYARYHAHEPSRSALSYEKACEGGVLEGCHRAGVFWKTDHYRADADAAKAVKLLKKACDGGVADACGEMAELYRVGKGTIRRNRRMAADLYQKACDGGSGNACHERALMYITIKGVKPDRKKAASLYAKACGANVARSCVHLAEYHFVGWGVSRDPARGRDLLELACSKGDALACLAIKAPPGIGGGTAADTARAWKEMVGLPSAFAVLDGAQTNRDFLGRLSQLKSLYQRIDTDNADPELRQYIADWLVWTDDATRYFSDQERRREMAGELQFLTVIARVATEKNEYGERDAASVERGMRKGVRDSKIATRNPNEQREANALGERARTLAAYRDPLSLRLEMAHGVYLPPAVSKPED